MSLNISDPTIVITLLSVAVTLTIFYVIFIFYQIRESRKHKQILMNQAVKRKGEFKGSIISNPTLKFNYSGSKVEIYSLSDRFSINTYIEIIMRKSSKIKMKIFKESNLSKVAKAIGLKDIQLGYDEFDSEVIVKGTNKNFITDILTNNIQQKILSQMKNVKPFIYLKNDRLRISIRDFFIDDKTCDELIELGLRIADRIKDISAK